MSLSASPVDRRKVSAMFTRHCVELCTQSSPSLPHGQASALKLKGLDTCRLGALHSQDLLSDHTQHLQVDAVELVEASPGAAAGQPLEELALQARTSAQDEVCKLHHRY
jgi:hypothetical protein